jgi:PKD repeat protein
VATVSRTYTAPGVYNAGAEVRAGGRSSSCNVTITAQVAPRATPSLGPNAAPLARFKINPNPPTGDRPLTVDFNACQSSDPDGDRLLFRFDVFDGLYDSLHCRREHTYRTAGSFETKVCVTDDFPGHADICQSYTVTVK